MFKREHGIVVGLALMTVVFATSPGCARDAKPGVPDEHIAVVVDNIGWSDVVIYSTSLGSRIRLGQVTAQTTGRFRIPRQHRFATDLELIADPIGSPSLFRSGPVAAQTGQEIR